MPHSAFCLLVAALVGFSYGCDIPGLSSDDISRKAPDQVRVAEIAVKGLVTDLFPPVDAANLDGVTAEIWLQEVYKGSEKVAASLGSKETYVRDKRVNVSHWSDVNCPHGLKRQKTYILLLEPSRRRPDSKDHKINQSHLKASKIHRSAAIEFSQETEVSILSSLGWHSWSDWGACSKSCNKGFQERRRLCNFNHESASSSDTTNTCPSYNIERRGCNIFPCSGAIDTLSIADEKYFKPSREDFRPPTPPSEDDTAKTKHGWHFKSGSYLLLPFREAFGKQFPSQYTVMLTIRPSKDLGDGVLFSLNAQESLEEYVSLEMRKGKLMLVHFDHKSSSSSGNNGKVGSRIIDIPATNLADGRWHSVAISIGNNGSSVRTYLDCIWIATQILHKNSLPTPAAFKTDLVVGYMFRGDISQLTVTNSTDSVSGQCSSTTQLIRDSELLNEKHSPKHNGVDYLEEEYVDLDWQPSSHTSQIFKQKLEDDNSNSDDVGSSGDGQDIQDEDDNEDESLSIEEIESSGDNLEIEWSDWSECEMDQAKKPGLRKCNRQSGT